jgi:SulP family sulfate permease
MFKKILPILQWLPSYKKEYFSGDLTAGLTVGIMLIPQGMAYAMIAGLPPVFGLYAALIPQIIYAFMGTSRQLAVGPVAMDSLLVAAGLGALSLSGIDTYIAMAVFLALFMGAIQLLLGVLRMGFLVRFLSKPVISGFTSGAAIIIGLSQLKHLLGIEITRSNQVHLLLANAFKNIHLTNRYALGIGLSSIVLIQVIKKINKKYHKRFPAALALIFLGVGVVSFFELAAFGVQIVGKVPSGLPSFQVPKIPLDRISELAPIAVTLALIAFMEAISVAKAVAEKHPEYELDPNQELIALGSANIMGAFFQSYPTTGGFSRTAINEQAGAKTGIAPLISAGIVGLTLLFLTPLFYYLPNAVLAAIIMVAVFGLIDVSYPISLYKTRKDEFVLLLLTFITTLTVGITAGILTGVLVSLLILLYRISVPHIAIIARIKNTNSFKEVNRFETLIEHRDAILALRMDAPLFFGNTAIFKTTLSQNITQKGATLKLVILCMEAMSYIDTSGLHLLKQIIEDLQKKEIKLLFSGVSSPIRDLLDTSGIVALLGEENLFSQTHEAEAYADEKGFHTVLSNKN